MNPTPRLFRQILSVVLMALAAPALAQNPLIFARETIRIEPTTSTEATANNAALPPRESIRYDVEIRNADALRLEYIHTLNTLTPATGILIALDAPEMRAMPAYSVMTPVDVLFVAEDGSIVQIYPEAIMADLTQAIEAPSEVKAFIFLKSGQAKVRAIRPRDRVYGSPFNPPPPVQN
jgi:uncharacterized membrane protein (UPF0127 family)